MHTESLHAGSAGSGSPGGYHRHPVQVVSTGGADPSDGPLAEPRPVRGRWRVDRHGHRPPVPGLPRPARAQGGVAHPPAPNGVRAVGPPGLRRPVDPRGGGGGPRDDPSRRPAGPGRGEARLHQLGQRPHRLRRSLGIESDPLYHRSRLCEALLETEPGPYGDYVLFPSRLEPIKRQSLAVEAMRHVRSPVRLVLVGSGPDESALRRKIEAAHLGDRVELAGRLPDEDLVEPLPRGPGRVLRAVRRGLRLRDAGGHVRRSPGGGHRGQRGAARTVREGVTGFVAAPKPRAIGAALDRLHERRRDLGTMGAAGRETVEALVPPWPEVVARLLS